MEKARKSKKKTISKKVNTKGKASKKQAITPIKKQEEKVKLSFDSQESKMPV